MPSADSVDRQEMRPAVGGAEGMALADRSRNTWVSRGRCRSIMQSDSLQTTNVLYLHILMSA